MSAPQQPTQQSLPQQQGAPAAAAAAASANAPTQSQPVHVRTNAPASRPTAATNNTAAPQAASPSTPVASITPAAVVASPHAASATKAATTPPAPTDSTASSSSSSSSSGPASSGSASASSSSSVTVAPLTDFEQLLKAVVQPQLGQPISSADSDFAQLLSPSLASILQDDSTLLTNASNNDLLKMNLITGGKLPDSLNANTLNSLKNNIRMQTQVDTDITDPRNPKWSGSAEAIADLVTTLGPAITLGVIVFWGVDLNGQKVVNLARGTLAMWVSMTLLYLLAKASTVWLPNTLNCTVYNEAKIRNLILWVSSLCATSFLILHGMLVSVGFKTQNTITSDTVSAVTSSITSSTGGG